MLQSLLQRVELLNVSNWEKSKDLTEADPRVCGEGWWGNGIRPQRGKECHLTQMRAIQIKDQWGHPHIKLASKQTKQNMTTELLAGLWEISREYSSRATGENLSLYPMDGNKTPPIHINALTSNTISGNALCTNWLWCDYEMSMHATLTVCPYAVVVSEVVETLRQILSLASFFSTMRRTPTADV